MDYKIRSSTHAKRIKKPTLKGVFSGRRQWIVNPAFQWRFVAFSLVTGFFLVLVLQLSNQYFIAELEHLGVELQLEQDHFFYEVVAAQRQKMGWVTLLVSMVTGLFAIGYGILFSHRIAGPLYRLRMHLEQQSREKRLSPLKFRDTDFFQEIPEKYNEMVNSLERKA